MLSDSSGASGALATVLAEPEIDSADVIIAAMRHIFALRHTRPHGVLPQGPIRQLALEAMDVPCHGDPVLSALQDIISLHVHAQDSPSATALRMAGSTNDLFIQDVELQRRGLNAEQRRDVLPWMRYLSTALTPVSGGGAPRLTLVSS